MLKFSMVAEREREFTEMTRCRRCNISLKCKNAKCKTYFPNRCGRWCPKSSGTPHDQLPPSLNESPSAGPEQSRFLPPLFCTPEHTTNLLTTHFQRSKSPPGFGNPSPYLHFSFLHHQLPVGVTTDILQWVGHVILHHLLHLNNTRPDADSDYGTSTWRYRLSKMK